jgi:hypothetical protein
LARLLTLLLLCSALTGCELIADFDRSKIPDDSPGLDGGDDAGDDAAADRDASTVPEDGGPDAAPPDEDAGDDDAGSDDDAG